MNPLLQLDVNLAIIRMLNKLVRGERKKMEHTTSKKLSTKKMVLVALFGALSAVLMVLEFPMPFVLPFIKMDFSELPIILGGYLLGPLAGTIIVVIKIGLNFVINGTETAGVGELANMCGSLVYMLPAVLIYRKKKSKKWAAISLIIATVLVSIVIVVLDAVAIFPVYAKAFGMDMEAIVGIGHGINPYITDNLTLMLYSVLPFNLFKYAVSSVITFAVYKRMKSLLHLVD